MENKKPLVAIQCITYNHEPYIRDALEGFLMQKTDFPFVAVVHDDASTDETATIIREYAEKYPDIIKPIFETENQYSKQDGSLGRIVNNAVAATGAKYIALCEGDDYWTDPLKLQKQFDILESNENISLSFHNAEVLNMYNGEKHVFVKNLHGGILPLWKLILLPWCTPTASFFLRASCIRNLERPKEMNGDMFVLFTCAAKGKIIYSNEVSSVYRSGTPGGASDMAYKTSLVYIYKKKIALMRYINRITKNHYLFFTTIKILWSRLNMLKCKIARR